MTAAGSVEREIVERRDQLVSRRTNLLRHRAAIISELRQIDSDLKDCAATARFFGLVVEFPPDEREEYERIRASQRETEAREQLLARVKMRRYEALQGVMKLEVVDKENEQPEVIAPLPPVPVVTERSRPTVREVSLNLLEGAGSSGTKAERIRDYLDRTYGLAVHEKTVGMTLYRLSKEGLAHRSGHTWFLGPARDAGTENPGVEAPGSIDETTFKETAQNLTHDQ